MPLLSSFLFAVAFLFGSTGILLALLFAVATTDSFQEEQPLQAELIQASAKQILGTTYICFMASIILLTISSQL